jgi:hypothetical protein
MRKVLTLSLAIVTLATGALAAERGTAIWLIFVDDLHLDFVNTGRLRTMLRTIVSELVREGDTVAVGSSGPSQLASEPTTDRSRIDSAIKKATGNGLKPSDIEQSPAGEFEVRYRASRAFSSAQALIAGVADRQDGNKALIYISNGYFDLTPHSEPELAHAAGLGGVTIFTIDPRLLNGSPGPDRRMARAAWDHYWMTTRGSLIRLAEWSGGFALTEKQSLADMLKRIDRAVRD